MELSLRPYQNDAVYETCRAFHGHDRVLISMPTGCGKSVCLAYLAKAWIETLADDYGLPKRVLWLAHMDQLIWQAVEHITEWAGEMPAVEKGKDSMQRDMSMIGKSVVVSSIQTMMRDNRREFFQPDGFGLVIVDEFHHAVAEGWQKVLGYFEGKLLGATATCDRTDEVPLGKVVDTVAYHYEVTDAVRDGWLAPIKQQRIEIDELDWSHVRATATDLSAEDLDAVILQENALHKICLPIAECCGDRQTLIFTPSVRSAEAIAEVLPRYVHGKVAWASGQTPDEERRHIVNAFRGGEYQYLASCDLLREGFDAPAASAAVIARPTQSRLVYAQMVGRILRGGPMCPVDGKTDALVLDLVGSSMQYKLATCADLLGGKWDAVVADEANRILDHRGDGVPADVMEALLEAASRADQLRAEQRRQIIAEAKLKKKTVDPFLIFADANDIQEERTPGWWSDMQPDEHQKERMKSLGIPDKGLSYGQAKQLIDNANRRARNGQCSYKQARMLRSRGFDPTMTMAEAGDVMSHMDNREGGFSFVGWEDGPRRAKANKRGHGVRYKELRFQYTVLAGTECRVRVGGGAFKPHTTTRVCQFTSKSIVSRTRDATVFALDKFELEVPNGGYNAKLLSI
jgi:superfamily II DNA or RNA helicase